VTPGFLTDVAFPVPGKSWGEIPPLRGPARRTAARRKKPGRSGRNDGVSKRAQSGAASGDEEGLRGFPGDGEQLEGGLARTAGSLLPTANGIGTDVEIGGEEGLAGVESEPDAPDFAGGNGL